MLFSSENHFFVSTAKWMIPITVSLRDKIAKLNNIFNYPSFHSSATWPLRSSRPPESCCWTLRARLRWSTLTYLRSSGWIRWTRCETWLTKQSTHTPSSRHRVRTRNVVLLPLRVFRRRQVHYYNIDSDRSYLFLVFLLSHSVSWNFPFLLLFLCHKFINEHYNAANIKTAQKLPLISKQRTQIVCSAKLKWSTHLHDYKSNAATHFSSHFTEWLLQST